jgi:hypothetical protein
LVETGPDEFVVDLFREGTCRSQEIILVYSGSPGLWSGNGEWILGKNEDSPLWGLQRNKKYRNNRDD